VYFNYLILVPFKIKSILNKMKTDLWKLCMQNFLSDTIEVLLLL